MSRTGHGGVPAGRLWIAVVPRLRPNADARLGANPHPNGPRAVSELEGALNTPTAAGAHYPEHERRRRGGEVEARSVKAKIGASGAPRTDGRADEHLGSRLRIEANEGQRFLDLFVLRNLRPRDDAARISRRGHQQRLAAAGRGIRDVDNDPAYES